MELCNKCLQIRVGDNNNGDTLAEALEGVLNAGAVMPSMAADMLDSIIPQAKKGGACGGCISFLQIIKSRLS